MPNIVKNTTISSLFDLIAPHSCRGCGRTGEILCDCCKKDIRKQYINICPICKAQNPAGTCSNCSNLPPTFIVGDRDNLIGILVHDYKYYSLRALAKPLAEILDQTLPSTDDPVSIVPLPTISKHIRERGFDHTFLLAKKLAKQRPNYQISKLLIRTNNAVQVGSSRSERIAQADQAYAIKHFARLDPNTTYLLLDDVWTTGASMQSAVKKLRQAGVHKIIIALLALSRID